MKATLTFKNERINIRLTSAFDEASAKKEIREAFKERGHWQHLKGKGYRLELRK